MVDQTGNNNGSKQGMGDTMIDRNGSVEPAEMVVLDIVIRLRDEQSLHALHGLCLEAADEIARLRSEINDSTKALSRAVTALMCKVDDNKRLRKAGDALTEWAQYNHRSDRCTGKFASKCVCGLDEHVKAWQESRRG